MSILGLPMFIEEILASALITLIITLGYRFLCNQCEMKQIKESMKEKQAKAKEFQKTNPSEASRIMNEVMVLMNKQQRMNMKPMLMTLIVAGLGLQIFGQTFTGSIVMLPFTLPYLGNDFGWMMWYIIVSVPLGYAFRKILGVVQ
jgi:uncharacterized membrane protein (DUF106 family)